MSDDHTENFTYDFDEEEPYDLQQAAPSDRQPNGQPGLLNTFLPAGQPTQSSLPGNVPSHAPQDEDSEWVLDSTVYRDNTTSQHAPPLSFSAFASPVHPLPIRTLSPDSNAPFDEYGDTFIDEADDITPSNPATAIPANTVPSPTVSTVSQLPSADTRAEELSPSPVPLLASGNFRHPHGDSGSLNSEMHIQGNDLRGNTASGGPVTRNAGTGVSVGMGMSTGMGTGMGTGFGDDSESWMDEEDVDDDYGFGNQGRAPGITVPPRNSGHVLSQPGSMLSNAQSQLPESHFSNFQNNLQIPENTQTPGTNANVQDAYDDSYGFTENTARDDNYDYPANDFEDDANNDDDDNINNGLRHAITIPTRAELAQLQQQHQPQQPQPHQQQQFSTNRTGAGVNMSAGITAFTNGYGLHAVDSSNSGKVDTFPNTSQNPDNASNSEIPQSSEYLNDTSTIDIDTTTLDHIPNGNSQNSELHGHAAPHMHDSMLNGYGFAEFQENPDFPESNLVPSPKVYVESLNSTEIEPNNGLSYGTSINTDTHPYTHTAANTNVTSANTTNKINTNDNVNSTNAAAGVGAGVSGDDRDHIAACEVYGRENAFSGNAFPNPENMGTTRDMSLPDSSVLISLHSIDGTTYDDNYNNLGDNNYNIPSSHISPSPTTTTTTAPPFSTSSFPTSTPTASAYIPLPSVPASTSTFTSTTTPAPISSLPARAQRRPSLIDVIAHVTTNSNTSANNTNTNANDNTNATNATTPTTNTSSASTSTSSSVPPPPPPALPTPSTPSSTTSSSSALSQALAYGLQLSHDLDIMRRELERACMDREEAFKKLQVERKKNEEVSEGRRMLAMEVGKAYEEWNGILNGLQERCRVLQEQIIPSHELDALRAAIITEIESPYRQRLETLIKTTDTLRKTLQEKENSVFSLKSQLEDREHVWRRAMESLHREYRTKLDREKNDRKELQDMLDQVAHNDTSQLLSRQVTDARTRIQHFERTNEDLLKEITRLHSEMDTVKTEYARKYTDMNAEMVKVNKSYDAVVNKCEKLRQELGIKSDLVARKEEELGKLKTELLCLRTEFTDNKLQLTRVEEEYRRKLEDLCLKDEAKFKLLQDRVLEQQLAYVKVESERDSLQKQLTYAQQVKDMVEREHTRAMEKVKDDTAREIMQLRTTIADMQGSAREWEYKYQAAVSANALKMQSLHSGGANAEKEEEVGMLRMRVLELESKTREYEDTLHSKDRQIMEVQSQLNAEKRMNVELVQLLKKKEGEEDTYMRNIITENQELQTQIIQLKTSLATQHGNATREIEQMASLIAKERRSKEEETAILLRRIEEITRGKEKYKAMLTNHVTLYSTLQDQYRMLEEKYMKSQTSLDLHYKRSQGGEFGRSADNTNPNGTGMGNHTSGSGVERVEALRQRIQSTLHRLK